MNLGRMSRSKKAIVTTTMTAALGVGAAVGFAPEALAAVIVGTDSFDDLVGTEEADTIDGLSGADVLVGLGGNDVLAGGLGVDSLRGGAGNDALDAGPGADSLFGGAGDDVLDGGLGVDYLFGGYGADDLRGGDGVDHLIGIGDGIPDTLDGGEGVDFAWAGPEDVRGAGIENWYVNETPPCERLAPAESPVGCNTLPSGSLYTPTTSLISGYAFDADIIGEIDVHVYQTPPGGSRQFLAAVRTTPPPEFRGWTFEPVPNYTVPHALPSGTTVEAFAINVDLAGQPAGVNPLLGAAVIP